MGQYSQYSAGPRTCLTGNLCYTAKTEGNINTLYVLSQKVLGRVDICQAVVLARHV